MPQAAIAREAARFFRRRFTAEGDPRRAVNEKAYMKSALRFHGVGAPALRRACADFCREHPDLSRADLRALTKKLYATGWFDERSAALGVLERRANLLAPADLPFLLGLVRASSCWAHVDWIATTLVGGIVAADSRTLPRLRRWAKDRSFWVRRTALLAQLRELRSGRGDFALFEELAAPMLEEREFFIRKAIGWVLREVSKKRPALVRGFLARHGDRASGLTLREATKYLP
jgi:3-methyladenine DNA glycosylase AlkD